MKQSYGHILTIMLLLAGYSVQLKAQNELFDPLGKPAVWADLVRQPMDTAFWAEYIGTSWAEIPEPTKAQVAIWQQKIIEQREAEALLEQQEKAPDVDSNEFWGIEEDENTEMLQEVVVGATREEMDFIQELKETVTSEPIEMEMEKQNIFENFVILEDMYMEQYTALGHEYVPYDVIYPNGEYDKVMWIEDKEKELKHLKENAFKDDRFEILTGNKQ